VTIFFEDETYAIRGAIFEVYREMGCGFLEAIYQECLAREFNSKKIPFVAEQEIQIKYKNKTLLQVYKPDFICYGKILIELKAVSKIRSIHTAQIINYMKATGLKLGLLVNFSAYPKVEIIRLVL